MMSALDGLIAALLLLMALCSAWGILRAFNEVLEWDTDTEGIRHRKGSLLTQLWKAFIQGAAQVCQTLLVLLVFVAIGWWWTGPSSKQLVVYPAKCSTGIKILPMSFSVSFKKYRTDRADCRIIQLNPTTYRLNKTKGEVYYQGVFDTPERLVDCAIISRTDWACSYSDHNSRLVIIDGLIAMYHDQHYYSFSLRRWQWWTVVLLRLIDVEPQGEWLIPEQHEYL